MFDRTATDILSRGCKMREGGKNKYILRAKDYCVDRRSVCGCRDDKIKCRGKRLWPGQKGREGINSIIINSTHPPV